MNVDEQTDHRGTIASAATITTTSVISALIESNQCWCSKRALNLEPTSKLDYERLLLAAGWSMLTQAPTSTPKLTHAATTANPQPLLRYRLAHGQTVDGKPFYDDPVQLQK